MTKIRSQYLSVLEVRTKFHQNECVSDRPYTLSHSLISRGPRQSCFHGGLKRQRVRSFAGYFQGNALTLAAPLVNLHSSHIRSQVQRQHWWELPPTAFGLEIEFQMWKQNCNEYPRSHRIAPKLSIRFRLRYRSNRWPELPKKRTN